MRVKMTLAVRMATEYRLVAKRVVQRGNLMSHTFMYVRVNTPDQSPANQIREVATAGFTVSKRRLVVECIAYQWRAKPSHRCTSVVPRSAGVGHT